MLLTKLSGFEVSYLHHCAYFNTYLQSWLLTFRTPVMFQDDDRSQLFEIPVITDNFLSERPCVMKIYCFKTFKYDNY